jgi:iron complex transport system substrate-binding protein
LSHYPSAGDEGLIFLKEARTVEMRDNNFPARIVCLSYDVLDILCSVGGLSRIAGKPSGAERPGTGQAQTIGGFGSPDFETIVALRPDMVIGYGEICGNITARLIRQGITALVLQHTSLGEIYQTIGFLGKICDKTPEAAALTKTMRRDFEKIAAEQSRRSRRPTVYFEEWNKPYVCGIQWVSEIIAIAGGNDGLAHRCHSKKFMERAVTTEEVTAAAPEIILASWCGNPVDIDSIKRRPGWESIPAVKNGHVYEIPGEIILQPGPGLVEGARYLQGIINRFA